MESPDWFARAACVVATTVIGIAGAAALAGPAAAETCVYDPSAPPLCFPDPPPGTPPETCVYDPSAPPLCFPTPGAGSTGGSVASPSPATIVNPVNPGNGSSGHGGHGGGSGSSGHGGGHGGGPGPD